MRQWIRAAARLYPADWRRRYGAEFDALLEDIAPSLSEFFNVLGGAIRMRLLSDAPFWKVAAMLGVAGAVAIGTGGWLVSHPYRATVTLKAVTDDSISRGVATVEDPNSNFALAQIRDEVMSRSALISIIRLPELNLYADELSRMPVEDVVQKMRDHMSIRYGATPESVSFSFDYPDQAKAEGVAREVAARLVTFSALQNRYRVRVGSETWKEPVGIAKIYRISEPPVARLGIGEAWLLAAIGLAAGLFFACLLRQRRRTLQVAGLAAAGCAAGWLIGTLSTPQRYQSVAVLMVTPPMGLPARVLAELPARWAHEEVQRVRESAMSDQSLQRIVERLNLYPEERRGASMPEIVRHMRQRDLHVSAFGAADSLCLISFTYKDASQAQAAVRQIVTRMTEQHGREMSADAKAAGKGSDVDVALDAGLGQNLEVLDPASLPQQPLGPRTRWFAMAGIALGLLIGWLKPRFRGPILTPRESYSSSPGAAAI